MRDLWKRPALFTAVAAAAMLLARIHPWGAGGLHHW